MAVTERAERIDGDDDGDGDAGGDQRVFDGGGAALRAAGSGGSWCSRDIAHGHFLFSVLRAGIYSSAIRCDISGTSAGGIG